MTPVGVSAAPAATASERSESSRSAWGGAPRASRNADRYATHCPDARNMAPTPKSLTPSPSPEHRLASTDSRAPTREYRLPSTAQRVPSNEHRVPTISASHYIGDCIDTPRCTTSVSLTRKELVKSLDDELDCGFPTGVCSPDGGGNEIRIGRMDVADRPRLSDRTHRLHGALTIHICDLLTRNLRHRGARNTVVCGRMIMRRRSSAAAITSLQLLVGR